MHRTYSISHCYIMNIIMIEIREVIATGHGESHDLHHDDSLENKIFK